EHLQRLVDRLLGGQPCRERWCGIEKRLDVAALIVGQGAVEQPSSLPLQHLPGALHLDHVESDVDYGHGRLQNQSLIGANHAGAGSTPPSIAASSNATSNSIDEPITNGRHGRRHCSMSRATPFQCASSASAMRTADPQAVSSATPRARLLAA